MWNYAFTQIPEQKKNPNILALTFKNTELLSRKEKRFFMPFMDKKYCDRCVWWCQLKCCTELKRVLTFQKNVGFSSKNRYCRTGQPNASTVLGEMQHSTCKLLYSLANATHTGDFAVDLSSVLALGVWILGCGHLQHAHAKRIYIYGFIVVLFVHLGSHELRSA